MSANVSTKSCCKGAVLNRSTLQRTDEAHKFRFMLVFLMAHELVDGPGFVMHRKAVNDCCAGFIET